MKNFLLHGAAAIALSVVMGTAAYAQPVERCFCTGGQKCIELTFPDGTVTTECSPSIDCDAQFNGNIPPTGPINTILQPVTITAKVNIPTYGDVDIKLNPNPTTGPTTLNSNVAGQRFPLTADIRFDALATLQSAPGAVYETAQEFHYQSTNVNSVNPFLGEVLTLQNDVVLVKQPGGPVSAPNNFTVKAGTSTFTLGNPPPPAPPPCRCIGGQKCFEILTPTGPVLECSPAIECQGSFTGTIPPAGQLNVVLTAADITASATVPSLGTVKVALDATRPTPATTINSVTQTQRFPARVDIRFPATATLEAGVGTVYRSVGDLHYGGDVTSVDPFNGETLSLQNDVLFQAEGASSSFILKAGESRIILGP